MSNSPKTNLTTEDIEVRVWGFVVVIVTCILCFIVIALLYSVTFVTQPIKSMAPIDQAYTKMLNDIVLLIVGGIGGVMSKRAVGAATNAFKPTNPIPPMQPTCYGNNQSYGTSYPQTTQTWTSPSGALPAWVNPPLDETWTPGPPPTTPPDHMEDNADREHMAMARKEVE
jgi:hypothetical protein